MTRLLSLTIATCAALFVALPAAAQDTTAPVLAPPTAPAKAPTEPVPEAPAPASVAKGDVNAPAADKARIVFFRPSSLVGLVYSFKVREGTDEIGMINNGGYFVADLAPGKHAFEVHTTSKDRLNLEMDGGETYYVKCTMSMGLIAYTPNVTPSDKASFDKAVAKLHLTSLK